MNDSVLRLAGVALAAMLAACGLPIPTEGATDCERKVYVEKGAPLECVHALEMVNKSELESGVNMHDVTIEFLNSDSVAEFGHANANGYTEAGSVVVPWDAGFSLVHEAFHVRDGSGHCHWSDPSRLALFDQAQVYGEFYDECVDLTCYSASAYRNAVGQLHGYNYTCVAGDQRGKSL
jgi:hypothetical protein